MNYIYIINLYKKDKKIHSEQLLSVGNYKSLNTLLVGEDDITPGDVKEGFKITIEVEEDE